MNIKVYSVKSIFLTTQGEGFHLGKPAVFLRFVGCNMWSGYEKDRINDSKKNNAICPLFCDTDFTKENSLKLSADEIVKKCIEASKGVRFIVITGGEPLLQLDSILIQKLKENNFYISIETNGSVSLSNLINQNSLPDWIACSPKNKDLINIEYIDELKLVYPTYSPKDFNSLVEKVKIHSNQKQLWLQPEDGPKYNESKNACVEYAIKSLGVWRTGIQAHKIWGVE